MGIKIGCYEYEVIETECVNKFTPRKGEIDYFERVIRIDKDMTPDDKKETLIHEILHGIEHFMDMELEEEVIKKFGHGLAMVLKDNEKIPYLDGGCEMK